MLVVKSRLLPGSTESWSQAGLARVAVKESLVWWKWYIQGEAHTGSRGTDK